MQEEVRKGSLYLGERSEFEHSTMTFVHGSFVEAKLEYRARDGD